MLDKPYIVPDKAYIRKKLFPERCLSVEEGSAVGLSICLLRSWKGWKYTVATQLFFRMRRGSVIKFVRRLNAAG